MKRRVVAFLPSVAMSVTPGIPSKTDGRTGSANTTSISRTALPVSSATSSTATSSTLAHEGDAVAHALDFGQHVRREEDGLAGVAGLVQQVVELVLDERVEARGGLVEDEQLGPVHERLDEADLALVAGGEIGHLALEVAVQALGERGDVVPVHAAAQIGEVAQRLVPGEVRDRG